jgi:hypothetical protein
MGTVETSVNELLKAKSVTGLKISTGRGVLTGTLVVLVASVSSGVESLEEKMAELNVSTLMPSTALVPPKPASTPRATPSAAGVAAHPLPHLFFDYINGGTEMLLILLASFINLILVLFRKYKVKIDAVSKTSIPFYLIQKITINLKILGKSLTI